MYDPQPEVRLYLLPWYERLPRVPGLAWRVWKIMRKRYTRRVALGMVWDTMYFALTYRPRG
jgi:hypothetical protein